MVKKAIMALTREGKAEYIPGMAPDDSDAGVKFFSWIFRIQQLYYVCIYVDTQLLLIDTHCTVVINWYQILHSLGQ